MEKKRIGVRQGNPGRTGYHYGRVLLFSLGILLLLSVLPHLNTSGASEAATRVQVHDREELKAELKRDGSATIELTEMITVRETLTVRGTKVLTGPGELRRAIAANSAFGGTLLRVSNGSLTLKNITIHGRGDALVLNGKLYGWLVQVDGGQLVIGSGTVLKGNQNTTRFSDGGGAVRICHGTAVMNGGTITQNACVTGGAGVRVDSGGVFSMKGGQISGNRVTGRGAVDGFDGRGGGIYNRGTTALYGGSVTGNTVTGYHQGDVKYGGVGGGVANAGELLISGTSLSGNHGERGADLGLIRSRSAASGRVSIGECWLADGQVLHVGKGFHGNGQIHLVPEKVHAGIRLVEGLTDHSWKTGFSLPSSVRAQHLKAVVREGALVLVKERIATPTPVPTSVPTASPIRTPAPTYGYSPGGSYGYTEKSAEPGGVTPPATTVSPRTHPSYQPVATLDPKADYFSKSPVPSAAEATPTGTPTDGRYHAIPGYLLYEPAPTPCPTPAQTLPDYLIHEPAPTPRPTPAQALPGYLLYEPPDTLPTSSPSPAAGKSQPVEVEIPLNWHFSVQELRRIKEELREGRYEEYDERFLVLIRADRIE